MRCGGWFATILATVAAFLSSVAPIGAETVRLSPEKVMELAAKQSTAVRTSELTLKAQEAARMSAFTAFLPTISASASATHLIDKVSMFGSASSSGGGSSFASLASYLPSSGASKMADSLILVALDGLMSGLAGSFPEAPDNIYSVGFTVAQPLFTGGKILNAYRIADLARKAQSLSHRRTVEETQFAALQIYWGYVAALKGLEAMQETRQWFEALVRDQEKMYAAGLIIELDLLNSRIQLSNLRLSEMKMADMIRSAGAQLLVFLGLPVEGVISVDTSAWNAPQPPFAAPTAETIDGRISSRGDLQALETQLQVLRKVKSIQMAAYSPTVAGFYALGYSNQYSGDELQLDRNQSIGAQLNWTIFDWGKGMREAQKAGYQAQALELQLDMLRKQLRLKIADLADKVRQSRMALDIAAEDVETARKALDIAKKKYDAQAITNTELLTARNQLTAKTVAYAQARINAILAMEEYRVAPLTSGQTGGHDQTSQSSGPAAGQSAGMSGGAGGGMSGGMGR